MNLTTFMALLPYDTTDTGLGVMWMAGKAYELGRIVVVDNHVITRDWFDTTDQYNRPYTAIVTCVLIQHDFSHKLQFIPITNLRPRPIREK